MAEMEEDPLEVIGGKLVESGSCPEDQVPCSVERVSVQPENLAQSAAGSGPDHSGSDAFSDDKSDAAVLVIGFPRVKPEVRMGYSFSFFEDPLELSSVKQSS